MTRRYTEEEIDGVLHYDALAEAEGVTGDSYKTSRETTLLGIGLMQRSASAKDRMLRANGDVTNMMSLSEYLAVIERNGFKRVGEWSFSSFMASSREQSRDESLLAYYRTPGQFLVFDTYSGRTSVNGGHIYYNVRPLGWDRWKSSITSSGSWYITDPEITEWEVAKSRNEIAWCGDHDCREAVIHNMAQFARFGEFIEPWTNPVRVWFLHHMDTKDEKGEQRPWQSYDASAISYQRALELPEEVRAALSVDRWNQNDRR